MVPKNIDEADNKARMARGEPYYAFSPELIKARARCEKAITRYNDAREISRREQVRLWRDIIQDPTPLPPPAPTEEEDERQFDTDCWVCAPIRMDYGTNTRIGSNVFINYGCCILDTCLVTIGARTMMGPNVSFYSATHPLDPLVRNGTQGPELGGEIHVGEDCWIGGGATILPGVTLGRGAVVGAGAVVTKSVPAFHVVAGNPARVLRKIETSLDPERERTDVPFSGIEENADAARGAEVPMAEAARKEEGKNGAAAATADPELQKRLDKMHTILPGKDFVPGGWAFQGGKGASYDDLK